MPRNYVECDVDIYPGDPSYIATIDFDDWSEYTDKLCRAIFKGWTCTAPKGPAVRLKSLSTAFECLPIW
jgi:hypothetical protein